MIPKSVARDLRDIAEDFWFNQWCPLLQAKRSSLEKDQRINFDAQLVILFRNHYSGFFGKDT